MLIVDELTEVYTHEFNMGQHTIGFQDMSNQDTYIVHVHHGLQDISSQDTVM